MKKRRLEVVQPRGAKEIANVRAAISFLGGPAPLLFGDPEQIEAVHFLHLFERALPALSITGYRLECWCCQGIGRFDCANSGKCTNWHMCGACNGVGSLEATRERMETCSRDQLRVIAAEVEELLEVTA
jgi:hypothetical protein